jgi:hypothetical protein
VIAEYWPLSSAVQVVSILSAESFEKIMELVFEWNDVFDIDVYPAVSADEGLRIGPEALRACRACSRKPDAGRVN